MDTPENVTEALPQHGDHPIVLGVDQPRGVVLCTTCAFDIALCPPEWLGEHNTDVEDQDPVDTGVPVDPDSNEPLEVDHEVKRRPAPE